MLTRYQINLMKNEDDYSTYPSLQNLPNILNPNREKEDIVDVCHHKRENEYYIHFKIDAKVKVAQWKKTLGENRDIILIESGISTIAFQDCESLKKALDLMVENKFIEENFVRTANETSKRSFGM